MTHHLETSVAISSLEDCRPDSWAVPVIAGRALFVTAFNLPLQPYSDVLSLSSSIAGGSHGAC